VTRRAAARVALPPVGYPRAEKNSTPGPGREAFRLKLARRPRAPSFPGQRHSFPFPAGRILYGSRERQLAANATETWPEPIARTSFRVMGDRDILPALLRCNSLEAKA
jgi:hypothetical protein